MTLKFLRPALTLLSGIALAGTSPAQASETEKVSRTFPITADGTVSLDNVNGSVEITAWDKPEVSVTAEIRGKTTDDLSRIRVEFETDASRVAVKTKMEKKSGLFWGDSPRGEVRYQLRVPAGVSLQRISTVNATIKIEGVRGEVHASTVNGRIQASGLASQGKFSTVNGSVLADYDATASTGRIDLNAVNGACTLRLPAGSGGQLRASTVNGSVTCDLPITLEKSSRRSLRGSLGGSGAEISLNSVNGSLRIESKPAASTKIEREGD
jgi:DUF4097 and DUF4098 domain-containing protein YvlB